MKSDLKIFSLYHRPPRRKFETPGESHVVKDELVVADCDINNIVNRYKVTGSFLNPGISPTLRPQFGDFSSVPDLMQAQQQLIDAQLAFDALPASVRRRFSNDPFQMLTFLEDKSNLEEAIRLGLVNKPAEQAAAPSPAGEVAGGNS